MKSLRPYSLKTAERAAVKQAIRSVVDEEISQKMDEFNREVNILVWYVLHQEFGFGEKRIKDFARAFDSEFERLHERYELDRKDDEWYAVRSLREDGIDCDAIIKEMRDGRKNSGD